MSLLTPPNTSHRAEKENRFDAQTSVRTVVWSPQNQIHNLSTPMKARNINASATLFPGKSILKKRPHIIAFPEENQREITPEPSDPLVNLTYLEYPVFKILALEASLRDLIEGYNILAARLRACVTGSTDADASWPLFQPLRKNVDAFVKAVVRDLNRALVDPAATDDKVDDASKEETKFFLPSPKSSPSKQKKQGVSAEEVKYARDLCTTCHSVIKLLGFMLTVPAIYSIFSLPQLREILDGILSIPLADSLPTPNARKTYALAIWLLQTQHLPAEVVMSSRDRIAYAFRRGMDGELGKEGKKGSNSDALKAIHDLSIFQPSTFVPAFSVILPSILSNLLAPTLTLRTQAAHALGGFVIGCTSIERSSVHARVSEMVATFLTTVVVTPKKSPTKNPEPTIIRTLRTTLSATDPEQPAQGPVWALHVLTSFIVLLGPVLCANAKLSRIISALLSLTMRHKKSSLRAMGALAWRPLTWVYFQPPLQLGSDSTTEDCQSIQDRANARNAYWKLIEFIVESQAGVSTVAAVLRELPGDEGLRKAISVLEIMVTKKTETCGDSMETIKHLVNVESEFQESEWSLNRLLPRSLFSSNPGLLSTDFKALSTVVQPIFDEVASFEDLAPLSREDISKEFVFSGFINIWRKALSKVQMYDDADTPAPILAVWDGLMKANVSVRQDAGDKDGICEFGVRAVSILVDIIEDKHLDLTAKPPVSPRPNQSSLFDSDDSIQDCVGSTNNNNGFLKLRVVRDLWSVMNTIFPIGHLAEANEKLLACLMNNEEDLVECAYSTRVSWSSMCMELLNVSDAYAQRMFWGYEVFEDGRSCSWSWTSTMKALVWRAASEQWIDQEGHWEGAIVLLGIPFTELYHWGLSADETTLWEKLLQHAISKALDYGIDAVVIYDNVASFVAEKSGPAGMASTQAAEVLMSQMEMAEARELPESALAFVNSTMISTYPPDIRCKDASLWMARALQSVIENCPAKLCLHLFEILQDGICLWFVDENRAWTEDNLTYDIIPLYEHILLRIRVLPIDAKTLAALSPILESVFTGRTEIAALTVGSFNEYWASSYAKLPIPAGGWPTKAHQLYADIMGQVQVKEEAVDNVLQPAFITSTPSKSLLSPRPSTPTTPVSVVVNPLLSPPRPHKSMNFLEAIAAPQSPASPVRIKVSLHFTPVQNTRRTPLASRSIASTGKQRRVEVNDKENKSPRALTTFQSVADRIANSSENPFGLKPFNLGKRCAVFDAIDEEWNERPSPLKRGRMNGATPMLPSPSEAEDERNVAETLLNFSHEDSPSINSTSPLKRKRLFMEAVEIPPRLSLAKERKLRHAASLDSQTLASVKSSKVLGKMRLRGGALPKGSLSSFKRRKSDGGDPFLVSNKEATTTRVSSSDGPSSDDDPHLGQVTPHHLISPPLRTRGKSINVVGDDVGDPPSDDSLPSSSSPLKDVMARRLHREVSLTKLTL